MNAKNKKRILLVLILFLNINVFSFTLNQKQISIFDIKAVDKPKRIDYAGIYRVSTSEFIIIYCKREKLFGKLFVNASDTDVTVNYSSDDGSITISGKRYELAICNKTVSKDIKRGTLGLLNDSKEFFKVDHRGFFELRYPEVSFLNLKQCDIVDYSPYELRLMRNQLFARHGYTFTKGSEMDIYFSNQKWYKNISPKTTNIELNDIEQHNVNLILTYEGKKKEEARRLCDEEIDILFTSNIKSKFEINFPIVRVYRCKDNLGKYYLVLTEKKHTKDDEIPTDNSAIKAFYIKKEQKENDYSLLWSMTDYKEEGESGESSIWFWTRYFDIKDVDGDGEIDPIIVYGTKDYFGSERVKILIYYKGKKRAIRHYGSELDDGRQTLIDNEFYDLPISLQKYVKKIMKDIEANDHTIFQQ